MKRIRRSATKYTFERDKSFSLKERRIRMLKSMANAALCIFIGAVFGYGVVTFVAQGIRINGPSMESTYQDGDVVLLNKLTYKLKDIERYDVVAIKQMGSTDYYDVKRVVALPGESVQIVAGKLIVNGKMLEDMPYDTAILSSGLVENPITLKEDEYFVLGDNVNNSEDSRYFNYGNLMKSEIKGKVVYEFPGKD